VFLNSMSAPLAVDPQPTSSSGLRIMSARWSSEGLVLRFESPRSGVAQIELFDLAGRRLWGERGWSAIPGANSRTVSATVLPAGLYYVRLRIADESAAAKV